MPTLKHRINITTDREVETALKRAAKRDGVPLATKAGLLLRRGLEIEEDIYFADLAKFRMQHGKKYLSHHEAWK